MELNKIKAQESEENKINSNIFDTENIVTEVLADSQESYKIKANTEDKSIPPKEKINNDSNDPKDNFNNDKNDSNIINKNKKPIMETNSILNKIIIPQIKKQIEYYFSDKNYYSDSFLLEKARINQGSCKIIFFKLKF